MTKVVFRKYKEGDIIALFPEETNRRNLMIMSYQHIGQHGEADYEVVIKGTKPATEQEYTPLLNELTNQVGYENLRIMKKCRPKF